MGAATQILNCALAQIRKISGSVHDPRGAQTFFLSEHVYLYLMRNDAALISIGIEGMQTVRLTLPESEALLRLTIDACEQRSHRTINIRNLAWSADGRHSDKHPHSVKVVFAASMGTTHMRISHDRLTATLAWIRNCPVKIYG